MTVLTVIGPRRKLNGLRWADDLHYPHRRQTVRRHMCAFGLHWPISWGWYRGGYSSPPEYGWACEMCGKDRLPYRAVLWPIRDIPVRIAIWRDERRQNLR